MRTRNSRSLKRSTSAQESDDAMTTHKHNESRSEDASNVPEDDTHDVLVVACNADGPLYELTTHYLFYGPAIPADPVQAAIRADMRDSLRRLVIIDYRLI